MIGTVLLRRIHLEIGEANYELFTSSLDYRLKEMQVPCAKTQLSKRSSQKLRHAWRKEVEVTELRLVLLLSIFLLLSNSFIHSYISKATPSKQISRRVFIIVLLTGIIPEGLFTQVQLNPFSLQDRESLSLFFGTLSL